MGGKPTKRMAPMEKGYRPELDTSPECSEEEKEKYQSILGATQWMVSLGRYDINHAVMSMSRFRALGEAGSGTDTEEFEEDWSQKWILIENSV